MTRPTFFHRSLIVVFTLLATSTLVACREQRSFDSPRETPSSFKANTSAAETAPSAPAALPDNPPVSRRLPDATGSPVFRNVADELGIDFTFYNDEVEGRYFLPEVMGGGAAWLDYDLDGWLDAYLINGAVVDESTRDSSDSIVNRLYRNSGGTRFDDVAIPSLTADPGFGQGCCIGDYDADGFPDIYVTNFGANVLLRNNGDGTFQSVAAEAKVDDPLWGTSPVWTDLNGDGYLDLYVTNYLALTIDNLQVCNYNGKPGYCGPGTYEAAPDRVFVNNADGTFTESAESLGLNAPNGKGLAIAVTDFNNDTIPEIYVANDMVENVLYQRTGTPPDVGYENIAALAGCAVSSDGSREASMGVACADFNGDGLVDVFLTHYHSQKNTLYRNLGNMLFDDDSRRTRIAATSFETLGFGTVAFDYDQDGAQDLFIANGHVLGSLHEPNEMRPQLLHNDGSGRFDDVSEIAGPYFESLWLGRGAAKADFDNDGDIDLLVTHLHRPIVLLENETRTSHHSIGLELRTQDRTPPLGARVSVHAGDRTIVVPVVGAGSYLSSSDERIVVGLGEWQDEVDIEIAWPSGETVRYEGLAVDQYWTITAGLEPSSIDPPR